LKVFVKLCGLSGKPRVDHFALGIEGYVKLLGLGIEGYVKLLGLGIEGYVKLLGLGGNLLLRGKRLRFSRRAISDLVARCGVSASRALSKPETRSVKSPTCSTTRACENCSNASTRCSRMGSFSATSIYQKPLTRLIEDYKRSLTETQAHQKWYLVERCK